MSETPQEPSVAGSAVPPSGPPPDALVVADVPVAPGVPVNADVPIEELPAEDEPVTPEKVEQVGQELIKENADGSREVVGTASPEAPAETAGATPEAPAQ